jgi:hypothetical protein
MNNLPRKHGKKWTTQELLRLEREWDLLELSVTEIAELHERTPKSIYYKLIEEDISDEDYINTRFYSNTSSNNLECYDNEEFIDCECEKEEDENDMYDDDGDNDCDDEIKDLNFSMYNYTNKNHESESETTNIIIEDFNNFNIEEQPTFINNNVVSMEINHNTTNNKQNALNNNFLTSFFNTIKSNTTI